MLRILLILSLFVLATWIGLHFTKTSREGSEVTAPVPTLDTAASQKSGTKASTNTSSATSVEVPHETLSQVPLLRPTVATNDSNLSQLEVEQLNARIKHFEDGEVAIILSELPEKKEHLKFASTPGQRLEIQIQILRDYASIPLREYTEMEAQSMANEVLTGVKSLVPESDDPRLGNRSVFSDGTHYANQVLGRLALHNNQMNEAQIFLKRSAEIYGSPTLSSFGPNFTLARELLQKNEKTVVLAYIDACLKFWKSDSAQKKANEWKEDIKQGKIPDFGANIFH